MSTQDSMTHGLCSCVAATTACEAWSREIGNGSVLRDINVVHVRCFCILQTRLKKVLRFPSSARLPALELRARAHSGEPLTAEGVAVVLFVIVMLGDGLPVCIQGDADEVAF